MKKVLAEKDIDVLCIGRACVDLYGDQVGSPLEDVSTLSMYIGGSPCNIAFGVARLGLRSGMLTRVGDDQMGRFVTDRLRQVGCDVSNVIPDPERLTGLAILSIKDNSTFPMLYYRENCADMALSAADIKESYIASARAIVISGTHLSTETTASATHRAVEYAKQHQTKVVLDVDYRPVLWGMAAKDDGNSRFAPSAIVTENLQGVIQSCDLIVGTEEEIVMTGGAASVLDSLKAIRSRTEATIVLKRGAAGCNIFDGPIPGRLEDAELFEGYPVDIMNVVGAGDAFLSGYLSRWINGESHEHCARYANACGSLVVSRHECAQAMPTPAELKYYLDHRKQNANDVEPGHLAYLHKATTNVSARSAMEVFAFDHRAQLEAMAAEAGTSTDRIPELKMLLVRAVEKTMQTLSLADSVGVLIDDKYGQESLNYLTGKGWWTGRPIELPASRPIEFEQGDNVGLHLRTWPKEHTAKCLIYYHPDDPSDIRQLQLRRIEQLYDACLETGHSLMLELIPPNRSEVDDRTISRSMQQIYDRGVRPEWWKLPSQKPAGWAEIDVVINNNDPYCHGIVMLGFDASQQQLAAGFRDSTASSYCKGFAVGRTIFSEPAKLWLADEIGDDELVSAASKNYEDLIKLWRARHDG